MNTRSCRHARWYHPLFVVLVAATFFSAPALAQTVVRVEEDWELIVGTPDSNSTAPQITCAFSPVGSITSLHAALELNHQSQPDFVAGGVQLQIWNGETPLSTRKIPFNDVMSTTGETVNWTQTMTLVDGVLDFEVINGTSASWGAFGGQGYLKAPVLTNLANLNAYDSQVSVAHSGVGYAANRVQSLVLKRVRLVFASGEVQEDVNPKVVWSN